MQITKCEVIPIQLSLQHPVKMARNDPIDHVTAVFIRIETNEGENAWGCAVAHPSLTGEQPQHLIHTCQECAHVVPDLHPMNIEYSLAELEGLAQDSPAALCAFDLAFHDLLGLAAGMPLYRLLGGYRNRIQTSATVPVSSPAESVKWASDRAGMGFRMLKVKGGISPEEDVQRVRAIADALPNHKIRLDADGGYTVKQALDVARALEDQLEMLEQPTPPDDREALCRVTSHSPIPILADQSVSGPASGLALAAERAVDGLSLKMATCGGFRGARQLDAIARAAGIATMVGCMIEPGLLIAAGLHYALGSPNVRFADLDGYLDLVSDPTIPGFRLEEGWLVASEVPGLGCTVNLS